MICVIRKVNRMFPSNYHDGGIISIRILFVREN